MGDRSKFRRRNQGTSVVTLMRYGLSRRTLLGLFGMLMDYTDFPFEEPQSSMDNVMCCHGGDLTPIDGAFGRFRPACATTPWLLEQTSAVACQVGVSYGLFDDRTLWVRDGCAGRFLVFGREVKCSSDHHREVVCKTDVSASPAASLAFKALIAHNMPEAAPHVPSLRGGSHASGSAGVGGVGGVTPIGKAGDANDGTVKLMGPDRLRALSQMLFNCYPVDGPNGPKSPLWYPPRSRAYQPEARPQRPGAAPSSPLQLLTNYHCRDTHFPASTSSVAALPAAAPKSPKARALDELLRAASASSKSSVSATAFASTLAADGRSSPLDQHSASRAHACLYTQLVAGASARHPPSSSLRDETPPP